MQRLGKQIKVYRTDILQMSICRNEESKVNSTQLKKCKCQYAETRQGKLNIQNWKTADANMHKRGKQSKIYRTE